MNHKYIACLDVFLKNLQFNFTFWHFLLLLNINLKMWMHVCVNVFRNMHWLIFHFSYFMHFLNLLLTLPECSAQVLQREFMGLNLEQSVWFNRYLLNKTHDGGGPPSVQPSHSGRNGCVSWECLWRSQWWPQHWSVVLLSPLAWPWPEEQTHTVAQKAWLRLVTSSLLRNVIVPHKTLPDRHLSPLQ